MTYGDFRHQKLQGVYHLFQELMASGKDINKMNQLFSDLAVYFEHFNEWARKEGVHIKPFDVKNKAWEITLAELGADIDTTEVEVRRFIKGL